MNERLQNLLNSGRVKAVGGSGELTSVLETISGCDEAIVHLRKNGQNVGVLVYATKTEDAAIDRACDALDAMSRATAN